MLCVFDEFHRCVRENGCVVYANELVLGILLFAVCGVTRRFGRTSLLVASAKHAGLLSAETRVVAFVVRIHTHFQIRAIQLGRVWTPIVLEQAVRVVAFRAFVTRPAVVRGVLASSLHSGTARLVLADVHDAFQVHVEQRVIGVISYGWAWPAVLRHGCVGLAFAVLHDVLGHFQVVIGQETLALARSRALAGLDVTRHGSGSAERKGALLSEIAVHGALGVEAPDRIL